MEQRFLLTAFSLVSLRRGLLFNELQGVIRLFSRFFFHEIVIQNLTIFIAKLTEDISCVFANFYTPCGKSGLSFNELTFW